MSEIKVQCIDQAISFLNTPVISSGNVNYDRITFDFCSKWDGYTKTAIFYRTKDDVYYQLLDENNSCLIPNEVLGEKGVIYIGVFGTSDDKTITSQVLTYRILEGAITDDLRPADPTPDIYDQIISRYDHYDERLEYFEERFNNTSLGDAEMLGGETYTQWQNKLDNIQTTSRATLSTAGWYRVAEFTGGNATLNSFELTLLRSFGTHPAEEHRITVDSASGKWAINSTDVTGNTQVITKFRITTDKARSYAEIYWSLTSENILNAIMCSSSFLGLTWKAITPTLTTENADGVTVSTTYDIPSNATPTTSVDLANYLPLDGSKSIQRLLTIGSTDLAKYVALLLKNNMRSLEFGITEGGAIQLYDNTNSKNVFYSAKDGTNTWNGTASDCLPLTGGTIVSASAMPLDIKNTNGSSVYIRFIGKNGTEGGIGFTGEDVPVILDKTSASVKTIIHSGNYSDYNQFSKGISLTDASNEEGGEIRFAKPLSDTSFGGVITQDIWKNMMRFHAEHDGLTKIFNIDFSSMKEGANEALHTGNSSPVVPTNVDPGVGASVTYADGTVIFVYEEE